MIKIVLKIPESDISYILSKLVKLGIKNIKIKKNEKGLHLFRYKNTFENTNNEIDK